MELPSHGLKEDCSVVVSQRVYCILTFIIVDKIYTPPTSSLMYIKILPVEVETEPPERTSGEFLSACLLPVAPTSNGKDLAETSPPGAAGHDLSLSTACIPCTGMITVYFTPRYIPAMSSSGPSLANHQPYITVSRLLL